MAEDTVIEEQPSNTVSTDMSTDQKVLHIVNFLDGELEQRLVLIEQRLESIENALRYHQHDRNGNVLVPAR